MEYIEREAAKGAVDHAMELTDTEFDIVCDYIDRIPAADVQEARHGKWEEIRDAYGQLEGWMCKECGREMKAKVNYCPKCGAKMDGGNDNDR